MKKKMTVKTKKALAYGASALAFVGGIVGLILLKKNGTNISNIVPDDSVTIWEGIDMDTKTTIASLVLDSNFDPYTNVGKQIPFVDDIGANFVVEIISAG